MSKANRDKIIGGIIVAILFGVPLAIFLGPIGVGAFLVTLIIGLAKKKHTPPKRSEKQKQTDELITTILPTISNHK